VTIIAHSLMGFLLCADLKTTVETLGETVDETNTQLEEKEKCIQDKQEELIKMHEFHSQLSLKVSIEQTISHKDCSTVEYC